METIKYRQAIYVNGKFNNWHHWGLINDEFIRPLHNFMGESQMCKNSYQYIGCKDQFGTGKEIYEGDIIKSCNPNFHCDEYGRPGNPLHIRTVIPPIEKLYGDTVLLDRIKKGTVIGNTAEKPELME